MALAIVVATSDARPDTAGVLGVAANGRWAGSVGGGCADAAVVEAAQQVLAGGPPRRLRVGTEHVLPWEAAAGCGRELDVLVVPGPPTQFVRRLDRALAADVPGQLAVALTAPFGWCEGLPAAGADVHVLRVDPRPHLVLVGVGELSAALAALALQVGRRVTVLDPRPVHALGHVMPAGAEVVRTWPVRWLRTAGLRPGDAVLALSHDARIDDDALTAALGLDLEYVGALGSRATAVDRTRRLAGTRGLERLAQPAGLDLGGATAGETALALLAEVVAVGHGRSGRPLCTTSGSIRQREGAW